MDAEAAKLIGAGLAAIGAGMAALGVGNVFGSFLESALRNPAAADGQQGRLFIGFAAAELDRKSFVWGKSVSVRVDLGGRRIIQKNIKHKIYSRSKPRRKPID